mmetsp:Transcript_66971/g.150544  ORF Transcript_66971/g.150544 Transcript_66971/m.150544 type:complete len:535 (-) Transcript_66971:99-1703(-)
MDFDDLDDLEGAAAEQAVETCTVRRPARWRGEVRCAGVCKVLIGPGGGVAPGRELACGTAVLVVEEAESGGEWYVRIEKPCEGWLPQKRVQAEEKPFPGADCTEVTDVRVPPGRQLRLYLISDIHVDHKQNKDWVMGVLEQLDTDQRYFNCLLLPGDVCHVEALFEEVMRALKKAFEAVFFCFGNHDVWIKGEKKGCPPVTDSVEKLDRVNEICKRCRVYTSPVRLTHDDGQLILLPLWSWYHSSWDDEPDLPADLRPSLDPGSRVSDYRMCKWPKAVSRTAGFTFNDEKGETSAVLAQYFAEHNEAWMHAVDQLQAQDGGEVLSFSHFCPRPELILEKRNTFDQFLPKVSGSKVLERQIRRLRQPPALHVFGHTHVGWDTVLDGLRYLHWPLGNVRERSGQCRSQNDGGFLLLKDGALWAPLQFLHWSYYYGECKEERLWGSGKLAPWVSSGYAQMYPELRPALEARGLLKEPGPDGFAGAFPGGLENNDDAFWERHLGENLRWRCPPVRREAKEFPCENPRCILCKHNLREQ